MTKEELKKYFENVSETLQEVKVIIINQDKKIAKAKELLKRCYDNYIYLQPLRGDIEQFLSEVEK